jgi:aminoglycoside phosphotransferase (APT) family kinase protein
MLTQRKCTKANSISTTTSSGGWWPGSFHGGRPAAAPDRVFGHAQRHALFNMRLCRVGLGDEPVIRLPMMPAWAGDVEVELEWLPRLAGRLPLAIPVAAGRGEPTDEYPLAWSVPDWLDGTPRRWTAWPIRWTPRASSRRSCVNCVRSS